MCCPDKNRGLDVGNAAHFGGLIWGVLVAYTSKYNQYLRWTIGLGFLTALTALIFFSPFSTSYLSYKAYELHKGQKLEEAMVFYRKILRIDPDSEFAKTNLKQIEIHQLQEKAVELHTKQKYKEARQVYNQILSIDQDNEWAKENMRLLPPE